MILLYLTIIFLSILLIKQRKHLIKNIPPGPLTNLIPFIGHLPFINPKEPQKSFFNLSKKYGKIFSLQMGSVFTVVLSDAALIRETFKKDEFSGRAPLHITTGIFGGYGLICTEGDFWKDQRGLLVKWLRDMGMIKFGNKRESMQSRIMEGIELCVEEIHKNISKPLDPKEILTDSFGTVIVDFIFGFKYDWDSEEWKYLKYLQEEGVKLIGVNAGANFLPILRILPSNRRDMKFVLTGQYNQHKVYEKIVAKCEASIDSYPDCILKRFLLEKKDREDKNDKLAANCSYTQLNHLLADSFGAALDTTLATLRWFLLLISINKSCEVKIYEEMKSYGLKDKFELEDVENFNYLKAAIAECQRLKAVTPCGLPHGNPNKDCEIKGFFIPKNTMIMPLLYAVHMNEEAWPNAEIYDPNRFIDENGKFFIPQNFIPFQVGKRMCLGEELAKMLLYLFSANILRKFKIKLADDPQTIDMTGISGLTLSPPNYQLTFNERE